MIRKTALLVTGTVAGVVGVVSYNPPHLSSQIASSANTPAAGVSPSSTATETKSSSPTQPAPRKSSQSSTTKTPASPSATTSSTPIQVPTKSSGISGIFKGETSQTRWGPVQVQVTLTDGKITDVTTLQYPNGDRRSQSISSQVIPWLQDEVLQVQSAQINGISGATYTSGGFKTSLASALQKAGL